MARTQQTNSHEAQLAQIMEALRNQQPVTTPSPVKSFFADQVVDATAGSGVFIGRMKAAIESAGHTYDDGYQLERERQLRLRAERILNAQQH
jgi:hypothetical protein